MKRVFIFFYLLTIGLTLFAQDKGPKGSNTDYNILKIAGLVLVAGFVIWIVRRTARKK